MFNLVDMFSGVVFIIAGLYGLLLSYHILPQNPKEIIELWNPKFEKIMKIVSPIIILFGILLLLGLLS